MSAEDLIRTASDAASLNSRLVLVVGGSAQQRRALLREAAVHTGAPLIELGATFAAVMALVPRRQRPLQATPTLRQTVDAASGVAPWVLLDSTEILFDRSLQLDPVEALRYLARSRTVLAAWPGECRDGRLLYAPAQHPEHCDRPATGLLVHSLT